MSRSLSPPKYFWKEREGGIYASLPEPYLYSPSSPPLSPRDYPELSFTDNLEILPFYILGSGKNREDKIKAFRKNQIQRKQDFEYEKSKFNLIDLRRVERGREDEYVKRGSEINQYLRETGKGRRPQDLYFEEMIRRIKSKFMPLEYFIPNTEYIVVCRRTTNPYSKDLAQGFISTSNISLEGFGQYLQVIIIPKDAQVKIVNLEGYFNEEQQPVYEIYLKPNVDLVNVLMGSRNEIREVLIVDTVFFRVNRKFFSDVALSVDKNPLICKNEDQR